jgi:hypothetical protein
MMTTSAAIIDLFSFFLLSLSSLFSLSLSLSRSLASRKDTSLISQREINLPHLDVLRGKRDDEKGALVGESGRWHGECVLDDDDDDGTRRKRREKSGSALLTGRVQGSAPSTLSEGVEFVKRGKRQIEECERDSEHSTREGDDVDEAKRKSERRSRGEREGKKTKRKKPRSRRCTTLEKELASAAAPQPALSTTVLLDSASERTIKKSLTKRRR